jgi:hypothetical protein
MNMMNMMNMMGMMGGMNGMNGMSGMNMGMDPMMQMQAQAAQVSLKTFHHSLARAHTRIFRVDHDDTAKPAVTATYANAASKSIEHGSDLLGAVRYDGDGHGDGHERHDGYERYERYDGFAFGSANAYAATPSATESSKAAVAFAFTSLTSSNRSRNEAKRG